MIVHSLVMVVHCLVMTTHSLVCLLFFFEAQEFHFPEYILVLEDFGWGPVFKFEFYTSCCVCFLYFFPFLICFKLVVTRDMYYHN